MTQRVTRRTLLISLPAAGMTAALPAPGHAQGLGTPAQRLFLEWRAAIAQEQAAYDAGECDEVCAQLLKGRTALENRLMDTPSQTPRDLLCKIAAYTNFGLFALPETIGQTQIWNEARALIGGA